MDAAPLRGAYDTLLAATARPDLGAAADGGWHADRILAHLRSADASVAAVALAGSRPVSGGPGGRGRGRGRTRQSSLRGRGLRSGCADFAQGAMPTEGNRLHALSCRAVMAGQCRPPGRGFTRVAYGSGVKDGS